MSKPELVEPDSWKWSDIKTEEDIYEIIGFSKIYDCTPKGNGSIYEVPIREDIISNYMIVHSIEMQIWEETGKEPSYEDVAEELGMTPERVETIEYLYKDAKFWQPYTRGIIMINGEEGSGKDLFGNSLACRFRNYFGKTPIVDSKPTPDFGFCIPYSTEFMVDQINRINHFVSANSDALANNDNPDEWIDPEKGKIFLKGSTLLFSEFGNRMHRMGQNKPEARMLSSILKQWRHIEYCMICCDADERAVDPNYFLPRVTCRIQAKQHCEKDTFIYHFHPVKSLNENQALDFSEKPQRLFIIGNEPHPGLDGKCPYDIYVSKNAQGIELPKSLLKGRK